MGNIITEKREEIIDMVEELFVMGFTKPYECWKILVNKAEQSAKAGRRDMELEKIDVRTVRNYIDIVRRRIRNKYKLIDNNKVLKKELRDLDYMEKQLWSSFKGSLQPKDRASLMNTILKCKARRAKLLGLDTENLNINQPKTIEDLFDEYENRNNGSAGNDKQGVDSEVAKDPEQKG